MVRILLVEDDAKVSAFLTKGLREEGHRVDLAEDGAAGEARAGRGLDYDAIILDVLLPGPRDGFAVCQRMRAAGVETPVLMLTARDAVPDRVRGLHAGADDYLVKPFAFDELLARLHALQRRGRTRPLAAVLRHGPLELDTETHRVMLDGTEVRLSATEYRLLEYLLRRAGSVVRRDQIAEHVWGGDYDPLSNRADVYVSYLRRKLDGPAGRPLIHTVRGLGYMLSDRGRDEP